MDQEASSAAENTKSPLGLAPAEQWVQDLCAPKERRSERTTNPLIEPDHPSAVIRATHYLIKEAPEAIEGAGGDDATYRVACRVREHGVSSATCLELMLEHWNETKASPPWMPDELEDKVLNAYDYATGAQGAASGLAEFDAVDIEEPEKKRPKLYYLKFLEAANKALEFTGNPLVEDLIDQEAMLVVYGASNSGKTFYMLDIAYHIATGRPWYGRETADGLVVYIAAEGGRGILKRLAALKTHYGDSDVALAIVPCPVDMLKSGADTKAIAKLVAEAEADFGKPARMVVIDTLARALGGGDENASTDMGAFVKNADKVRNAVSATVAIVHHSGKDKAKGARGHSSLAAATDTEIEITAERRGELVARVTKQRDMDFAEEMKMRLDTVQIGKDAKGRQVSSCVLVPIKGSEFMQIELSGAAQEMWEAFQDAAKEAVLGRGEPLENWKKEEISILVWESQYIENIREKGGVPLDNFEPPKPRWIRRLRHNVVESGTVKKISKNQYVSGQVA